MIEDSSTYWVFTCSVDHPHPHAPPSRGRKVLVITRIAPPLSQIPSLSRGREGTKGRGKVDIEKIDGKEHRQGTRQGIIIALTLTLHTCTGKNRCAPAIARHLRLCYRSRQDFTYGQVRFDLSEPVRSHIWRVLARFSSTQVCNVRVG